MKWKISVFAYLYIGLTLTASGSQVQDIAFLIEQLGNEDGSVRQNAVEALGKIGEHAVPALIEALGSKGDLVRSNAAYVLGEIDKSAKDAIPALIEALRDEQGAVRRNAELSLGKIGEIAVPALIGVLGDESKLVRHSAASALEQIGTPEAMKAVRDFDWPTSHWHTPPGRWKEPRVYHVPLGHDYTSKYADVRLGYSVLPKSIKGHVSSPNRAYWYISSPPDAGVGNAFIQIYNERDYVIQLSIISARSVTVTWINEKLLHIEIWWGRVLGSEYILDVEREQYVYKEMVHWGQNAFQQWNETIRFHTERLKHEDVSVRRAAASMLGTDGADAAVPALIEALKDEDEGVRVNAAKALKAIGTPEALKAVRAFLTKDEMIEK